MHLALEFKEKLEDTELSCFDFSWFSNGLKIKISRQRQ